MGNGAYSYLNRALTLKLVPLGTAEPGSSPLFSFSAVFDALSFSIKNNYYFFLKKNTPSFVVSLVVIIVCNC